MCKSKAWREREMIKWKATSFVCIKNKHLQSWDGAAKFALSVYESINGLEGIVESRQFFFLKNVKNRNL